MSNPSPLEPEGPVVSTTPALHPSPTLLRSTLPSTHIQSVTLAPLSTSHAKDLYSILGGPENAHLYRYTPAGPFYDFETFAEEQVTFLIENGVFFPFAIFHHDINDDAVREEGDGDEPRGSPVGIICLMNIQPTNRTIEIGAVLFSPRLQRTTAATEAIYILMKHCFEDLGYRRVEWKANSFNEPSKRAAVRLGFVPEGVFRNHMIVKGRSRDSAWFSIVEAEWDGVKSGLESWLKRGNFVEGRQRRRLEEIRAGFVGKGN